MVYVVASLVATPGKGQEARESVKKIVSREKEITGAEVQVLVPLTPPPSQADTIVAIVAFDSLAAWADYQQKVQEDSKRRALVREGFSEKQCIVPNSFTRTLYQTPA